MLTTRYLILLLVLVSTPFASVWTQRDYWQQEISYDMSIDFDVETHQFTGKQAITYTNHSPDTLNSIYYHLYFNAFQPGSMMDIRSRTIADPSRKISDRISKLSESEIGYHKIDELTMNGQPTQYDVVGTILEVNLPEPILPGHSANFDMEFHSQVPVQIRKSGRDNAEGISYSMAQWYPKLCEYDYKGWHANPYIGREFYGVWGDFSVNITIDKNYVVAATGILQNPEEIGYGYAEEPDQKSERLTYSFVGENIHDFVWAADPDYSQLTITTDDDVVLRFFYQDNNKTHDNWTALPGIMKEAWTYIREHYGAYPYAQYAFIQGGDGGMEYPMATLITGERSIGSLVGVSVHELMHTWFQMLLGTNESLYAWMDEGFTSYASADIMNHLRSENIIPGTSRENPHFGQVESYRKFALSGYEEALSTHSDHFVTNQAYGIGSYTKGAVFLEQLKYIVGNDLFQDALKEYYYTWRFKHPTPNDLIRVFEKKSGLELDWFLEYFIQTTKTIDYAISGIVPNGESSTIVLTKIGLMPMPVDVTILTTDDQEFHYTIPLQMMRGAKMVEGEINYEVAEDWPWVKPSYELTVPIEMDRIEQVKIDASQRLADVDLTNNLKEITKP